MNTLADALKGFRVAEPKSTLPGVQHTPKPERSKVASNPVRVPINKQTAMLIRPNRDWLHQPLATPPPLMALQKDVDEALAKLKIERNDHALTRDTLGNTRERLCAATELIAALNKQISALKLQIAEKDGIIRQLEDIKL